MSPTVATASDRCRPLVVTDDPLLLDDLISIAAEVGAEVDVAADAVSARRRYAGAPMVLLDLRSVRSCLNAGLPRRPGVVLVSHQDSADPPWEAAQAVGAGHVALLPKARPWLAERLSCATGTLTGRMVAIMGGRGGAGASVLAAGLAVTAARAGQRALLIDGDPLGGGADLVLGWETLDGLRWSALLQTSGPVNPPSELMDALPAKGDLALLSWDRCGLSAVPVEAMAAAVDAGRRERQLVVVDLPRRMDDAAALVLGAADLVLLVVPAELRACAAAARVATALTAYTEDVALVVRGPAPGRLRTKEIARSLDLEVAGVLQPEPGLLRSLERGEPPAGSGQGPLAQFCQGILTDLGLAAIAVTG